MAIALLIWDGDPFIKPSRKYPFAWVGVCDGDHKSLSFRPLNARRRYRRRCAPGRQRLRRGRRGRGSPIARASSTPRSSDRSMRSTQPSRRSTLSGWRSFRPVAAVAILLTEITTCSLYHEDRLRFRLLEMVRQHGRRWRDFASAIVICSRIVALAASFSNSRLALFPDSAYARFMALCARAGLVGKGGKGSI